MGNLKFYLVIGVVALVAVAIAARVDAIRKIVYPAPAA
jgi:hypothetical protein